MSTEILEVFRQKDQKEYNCEKSRIVFLVLPDSFIQIWYLVINAELGTRRPWQDRVTLYRRIYNIATIPCYIIRAIHEVYVFDLHIFNRTVGKSSKVKYFLPFDTGASAMDPQQGDV